MASARRRRRPAPSLGITSTLLLTLARFSYCQNVDIDTRDTLVMPISFTPAQNWEGIDGSWNSFNLLVGTPAQTVRVQISTASQQTWVVAPRGCEGLNLSNCGNNRGNIFYSNESSTWNPIGQYYLGLDENLDYSGDADYGYDVVTLMGVGEGGPTVKNTTVGTFGAEDFWFGHFGVDAKPTNFTSFNDPSPSYMSLLKDQKLIPSLSFGYTAGAQYRFTKVLGSLTLGGYDSSRFVPNDLSFDFAPDNERDIVVAIQKVTSSADGQTDKDLLPSAVYAYIDSTVPQIWLPADACTAFEDAFGLTYDNDTELYLLDSDAHSKLSDLNPNVTFTLGAGLTGGTTVNITLPYAAFDLQATPPYQGLIEQSYYFPLRRAANDTQYTLGRTFLQEAYLFVDWERQNFNVSQCSWTEDMQANIVAVRSVNDTTDSMGSGASGSRSGSGGLGTGAIAGIAVAIAAVAIIGLALAFFLWRRRRNGKRRAHEKLKSPDGDHSVSGNPSHRQSRENEVGNVLPKAELDATQQPREFFGDGSSMRKEPLSPSDGMGGSTLLSSNSGGLSPGGFAEVDGKPKEVFEMPGDMPARQEAGGRQLSEKETMMVREARINGLDPTTNNTSPTTPISPPRFSATDEPGTGTQNSLGSDNAPSPLTPSSQSRGDLSASRGAATLRPPRRQVTGGEIIELSPFERDNLTMGLVSPITGPGSGGAGGSSGSGSDGGLGTMLFSPVDEGTRTTASNTLNGSQDGSGGGNTVSPVNGRRRFSYE